MDMGMEIILTLKFIYMFRHQLGTKVEVRVDLLLMRSKFIYHYLRVI